MKSKEKAARLTALELEITVLQAECGKLTHHDLNDDDIKIVGEPWIKYGESGSTKYQRFLNVVCRCVHCGKIFIASQVNNDRTNVIGPWEEGVRGRSFH